MSAILLLECPFTTASTDITWPGCQGVLSAGSISGTRKVISVLAHLMPFRNWAPLMINLPGCLQGYGQGL